MSSVLAITRSVFRARNTQQVERLGGRALAAPARSRRLSADVETERPELVKVPVAH